jgi:hypothetical protein
LKVVCCQVAIAASLSIGLMARVKIDAELQDHQNNQTKDEDAVHF